MAVTRTRFSEPPPPAPHGPFSHGNSPPPFPAPPPTANAPQVPFYPITLGRGLSLTWHMFRFGWRTFVAITVIAAIPIALIDGFFQYLTSDAISAWQQAVIGNPSGTPPNPSLALGDFPAAAFGLLILGAFIAGPIATFAGAALVDAIDRAMRGERLRARGSFGTALRRWKGLLALFLILTLGSLASALIAFAPTLLAALPQALGLDAGAGAFLFLIILVAVSFAGIFAFIRIAFSLQTLMVERASAIEALQRSWFLLGGSMLRLVGWMIVLSLVVGLAGLLFEIPAFLIGFVLFPPDLTAIEAGTATTSTGFTVVVTVVAAIGAAVLQPLVMIGATLLYFDVRFRHGENVPTPGHPPSQHQDTSA